jgi:hypothetical protein
VWTPPKHACMSICSAAARLKYQSPLLQAAPCLHEAARTTSAGPPPPRVLPATLRVDMPSFS